MFTKADLDGLPDSFFARPASKTGDDVCTVMANVTWQFNTVRGKRKERSDAQAALTLFGDARQRHKCSLSSIKCSRSATRSHTPWLQIVGRLPDGSQNGQDRRECGKIHQRFGRRQPAEIRYEVAELQKLKAADTNDPKLNRGMGLALLQRPAQQTKIRRR